MNWDRIEGNWKQIKGKVKEKWGKLTDDYLKVVSGKRDQLAGVLQKRYQAAEKLLLNSDQDRATLFGTKV